MPLRATIKGIYNTSGKLEPIASSAAAIPSLSLANADSDEDEDTKYTEEVTAPLKRKRKADSTLATATSKRPQRKSTISASNIEVNPIDDATADGDSVRLAIEQQAGRSSTGQMMSLSRARLPKNEVFDTSERRPCCRRCAKYYGIFPELICYTPATSIKCLDCAKKGVACEPVPPYGQTVLRELQHAASKYLAADVTDRSIATVEVKQSAYTTAVDVGHRHALHEAKEFNEDAAFNQFLVMPQDSATAERISMTFQRLANVAKQVSREWQAIQGFLVKIEKDTPHVKAREQSGASDDSRRTYSLNQRTKNTKTRYNLRK